MINQSQVRQRPSIGISPLLVIGLIFVGLLIVEVLLAARFWLQLAASSTSTGIGSLILELSHPLVAPFTDAQASARDVGSFERKTLVAAIAYLAGAVVLTLATILVGGFLTGSEAISRQKRRSSLQHLDGPLTDHSSLLLIGTVTLNLSPAEATRALKMLGLDRFETQLYVIPASGGCIIAAFTGRNEGTHLPLMGRMSSKREAMAIRRGLRAIEQRFQTRKPGTEAAPL